MKFAKPFLLFLVLNFAALALGSWLMGNGAQSEWYTSLNKAPWTPPGWVFGAAWTLIMICFSFYMTFLYLKFPSARVKILFAIQLFLNIIWNYIFFNQHMILLGLIVIITLTIIIALFTFNFRNQLKIKTLLILPYLIWLCIASSLNAYILFNN